MENRCTANGRGTGGAPICCSLGRSGQFGHSGGRRRRMRRGGRICGHSTRTGKGAAATAASCHTCVVTTCIGGGSEYPAAKLQAGLCRRLRFFVTTAAAGITHLRLGAFTREVTSSATVHARHLRRRRSGAGCGGRRFELALAEGSQESTAASCITLLLLRASR